MKILTRPDGFMLYNKLEVDFLVTSELPDRNMKLFRARPIFYMISDNPNVSLGSIDCSLYTRRIARNDDYYKRRTELLA